MMYGGGVAGWDGSKHRCWLLAPHSWGDEASRCLQLTVWSLPLVTVPRVSSYVGVCCSELCSPVCPSLCTGLRCSCSSDATREGAAGLGGSRH